MENKQTKRSDILPLVVIFSLFFIWAISSNLLPTMIRQLMKTCELNTFQASFTETAYWLAYFIFPIPIAMFMKRYSYKAGIIFGLLIAAVGGFLFLPAAIIKSYWAYLTIFFIIATGMCFLETAANPYVTALGDPATASRRLNLAQSFNGLGAFIAAMFLSKLVLSGYNYTRETLPADFPNGWEGYIQFETDAMKVPYIILAVVLVVVAVIIIFSKLPRIKEGEHFEGDTEKGKLIDFKVLKRPHLRKGVIAQFFYNGGQTAINSLFLVYCCVYAGMEESIATTFFGLYMLAFLLGRWIGTLLMAKFRPQDMLVVYAVVNVLLCGVIMIFGGMVGLYAMLAVSFFMSIMYPTQFSLALQDLGENTKSGSAFLVMAIVGNACLPQLTAYIMHRNEMYYQIAYIVPLICFIFCAHYGWKGYKVVDKSEEAKLVRN
ncbi:MAG: L-fucose:H+ symporter permease [Paludibacter sp.]|jgi:FHS family L-fucose permease-like MFS transporter